MLPAHRSVSYSTLSEHGEGAQVLDDMKDGLTLTAGLSLALQLGSGFGGQARVWTLRAATFMAANVRAVSSSTSHNGALRRPIGTAWLRSSCSTDR
jgi:hypothetical protein